ncbi:MAG: flagellar GTP-binding protein [Opitutaceae bacterium]|nr:flagellar GTP-binding protein [Opitutaceae bacterium]
MSSAPPSAAPGACFKFTVKSADEAATLIRERLGAAARVLSVRSVPAAGLGRLWSAPRLEVIAQVDVPAAPAPAARAAAEPEDQVAAARAAFRAAGRAAPDLAGLLRRAGIGASVLSRLQADPAWPRLAAAPLHRGLVEAGRLLVRAAGDRAPAAPLDRAAFLGSAGSGRTTALCKWLATEVFRRARLGHVVTAEFDRPNSPGPLPVFCEALGVPLAHYPAATRPATAGGFVYFDLPALSLRDPAANAPLAAFLDREEIGQRVLVLNAAYEAAALRAALAAGRDLAATHVVFTHLDEVTQWGRLWEHVWDAGLEPLFLSTGPSLSGDCEVEVLDTLVRRTLPVAEAEAAADEPAGPVALSTAA